MVVLTISSDWRVMVIVSDVRAVTVLRSPNGKLWSVEDTRRQVLYLGANSTRAKQVTEDYLLGKIGGDL